MRCRSVGFYEGFFIPRVLTMLDEVSNKMAEQWACLAEILAAQADFLNDSF